MSDRRDVEPVAVVGAGSVGCMLAAHLASGGHHIVVCGRARLERVAMTIDEVTIEHEVAWAEGPADLPPIRLAMLATKIHHTHDVAGWPAPAPSPAESEGSQRRRTLVMILRRGERSSSRCSGGVHSQVWDNL